VGKNENKKGVFGRIVRNQEGIEFVLRNAGPGSGPYVE